MENKLISEILKIINKKYSIDLGDLKLSKPPKKEMWDLAFNCWILSRELKKAPNLIAWDLLNDLSVIEMISDINCDGGFINIKISENIYNDIFKSLYLSRESLVSNKEFNNKNIVIDYIWANVWKPMHIGHMCTPNWWQVLVNLYRKFGYKVIADSHIWDWWIIFWKLIAAYKMWWDESKLKENAVDYLLELYIKSTSEAEKNPDLEENFRTEFRLLSEGNSESIELWREFTKYSIDAMQIMLDRLNVKADYNIWESFYEWLSLPKMEDFPDLKDNMYSIVRELIEKWIATRNDDNSVWVVFDDSLKIPSCILQKKDWTHWYLASDLAAIKYRIQNWNPDKIVYFVDSRQQLHLKQAFTIAKLAWWINDTELFHAFNWFISLKDWAMSTRKWRIIKLDDLLNESETRAEKIILEKRDDLNSDELKSLSKIIWIWAIKYWYLKKSRETDIVFDWDEFMTFEGNSWPYIQYAYVRSKRILEKSDISIDVNSDIVLEEVDEIELVKAFSEYIDILEKTAKFNMPHYLCWYAYDLTKKFNTFYNNLSVLNEENEDKKITRIKIVEMFSLIIKDSFSILWIDMPEKM